MKGEETNINKICIGYSTETGNSYQLAVHTCLSLKNKIHRLSQINQHFTFESNCLYILFISTTGQGDPPYAMRIFWKNIMNKNYKLPQDVKFCVYALGDRSYGDNFNMMGRKLRQRLIMLQAQQIIGIGLGDQQDRNGCFDQYFNYFYPALQQYIHNITITSTQLIDMSQIKKIPYKDNTTYRQYKIIQQKLLSSIQDKDIYWITLQLQSKQKLDIKLGDILQIYPHNNTQSINQMYKYFIQNNLIHNSISQQKLKQYLIKIANFNNVVNFTFFNNNIGKCQQLGYLEQTIDCTLDQNILRLFKDKIRQLGVDYDQYFNYIKKYRRNIRQVIADFNMKIPIGCFMRRLGNILPRKYSIAQIDADKNQISLLIKLEKFKVSSNRIVKGLCTHDLAFSPLGQIRMGKIIQNGQFQLNFGFEKNIKIAMISLGTGIAPFLSILDQAAKNNNNWQLTLFHSNRYQIQFPLNCQTQKQLLSKKRLQLYVTFTREKQPLQNRRLPDIIRQNIKILNQFKNGKIMICGGKEFCDIICRIFQEELNFDIKKMKKQKIICLENW